MPPLPMADLAKALEPYWLGATPTWEPDVAGCFLGYDILINSYFILIFN
jgi:hypothetical protein